MIEGNQYRNGTAHLHASYQTKIVSNENELKPVENNRKHGSQISRYNQPNSNHKSISQPKVRCKRNESLTKQMPTPENKDNSLEK